jgi:glycosyltransferase involved in cell wall biosynthesis
MDHISILTPIYNRNKWLPLMIINIQNLQYDKSKLEWIILDSKDGDKHIKLFQNDHQRKEVEKQIGIPIKYHYENHKMTIGAKRNKLTKLATHKICANMDSDDYYFETWLSHSMELMKSKKGIGLVGSKGMLFCYPNDNFRVTGIECYDINQIHESGMLYTKRHHKQMGGFIASSQGEGTKMIIGNENLCLCSDITQVMMCICHGDNTICKDRFKDKIINVEPVYGQLKEVLCDIFNIQNFNLINYFGLKNT